MRKRIVACLAVLCMIVSLCGCTMSGTEAVEAYRNNGLFVVRNNSLIFYDPESKEEFVIDNEYVGDNITDIDEVTIRRLSAKGRITDDGKYLVYLSSPDGSYKLNVFALENVAADPGNAKAIKTAFNIDLLPGYQIIGDSVVYVSDGVLHWYFADTDTDYEMCSMGEDDACYPADDCSAVLVEVARHYTLYKMPSEENGIVIEDSIGTGECVLTSYTPDLSEMVFTEYTADGDTKGVMLCKLSADNIMDREWIFDKDIAASMGLDIADYDWFYADSNTISANAASLDDNRRILIQDGVLSIIPYGSIGSTDDFRMYKRNTNLRNTVPMIQSADAPIIGWYYDESIGTEYIFSDAVVPFRTSMSGTVGIKSGAYDPIHSIFYLVEGGPKSGCTLYAYSLKSGEITSETVITENAHLYNLTFDEVTGTLFYYEKNGDNLTLCCITEGNVDKPQALLENAGAMASNYILDAKGTLQFETDTGRVFAWADENIDEATGTMYEISVGTEAGVSQIGKEVSYSSYGSIDDKLYFISDFSLSNGGSLYCYDGSSSTKILEGVQAIIAPEERHSNYAASTLN